MFFLQRRQFSAWKEAKRISDGAVIQKRCGIHLSGVKYASCQK
jgi:hypothetical protein